MKKLLALLLAVAIVMTMSIPAFAAETDDDDHSGSETGVSESAEIGVYGTYKDTQYADKVLSVDVSWTSMNFRYAVTQQGTWDPETHTYKDSESEPEWLEDTATITLANHSNSGVKASLGYTAIASGVTGTLSKSSVELETAEGTVSTNPPSDSVTFKVSGAMSEGDTQLGTITVTISENAFTGLDLSGVDTTEYASYIAEYLDENPGVLPLKLGADTITKTMIAAINDAVYAYNGNSFTNKVALTLYDGTAIDANAFQYVAGAFNSVTAMTATSLGEYAFASAGNITTFNFPKVTSIGSYAFQYCGGMQTITFGSVITTSYSSIFGPSTDSNLLGNHTPTDSVTLTLNAAQTAPNSWYLLTWGENGEFMSYTFANVVAG